MNSPLTAGMKTDVKLRFDAERVERVYEREKDSALQFAAKIQVWRLTG
jgi:hypothetical protein